MVPLINNYKLSKNNMIVYEIFNLNPFKTFDVNDLMQTINKYNQVISKRTVYRAVNNLTKIGQIYCCDISKGTRRFQLLKDNYYIMICEKCGLKEYAEIRDSDDIKNILCFKEDFFIKKMTIELKGICENCRKKNC